ncbi:hypothetical protein QZH41_007683 [Actinostola sp. cb2023]|nr:hypothetical protein QZH41_007683 [Actinostola sp. cb2023]
MKQQSHDLRTALSGKIEQQGKDLLAKIDKQSETCRNDNRKLRDELINRMDQHNEELASTIGCRGQFFNRNASDDSLLRNEVAATPEVNERKAVAPTIEKEPELMIEKEPELMIEKEPELMIEKEPELMIEKEPELMIEKEPELMIEKEPELRIEKEPELRIGKEPELRIEKEPEPKSTEQAPEHNQGTSKQEDEQPVQEKESILYQEEELLEPEPKQEVEDEPQSEPEREKGQQLEQKEPEQTYDLQSQDLEGDDKKEDKLSNRYEEEPITVAQQQIHNYQKVGVDQNVLTEQDTQPEYTDCMPKSQRYDAENQNEKKSHSLLLSLLVLLQMQGKGVGRRSPTKKKVKDKKGSTVEEDQRQQRLWKVVKRILLSSAFTEPPPEKGPPENKIRYTMKKRIVHGCFMSPSPFIMPDSFDRESPLENEENGISKALEF